MMLKKIEKISWLKLQKSAILPSEVSPDNVEVQVGGAGDVEDGLLAGVGRLVHLVLPNTAAI